MKKTASSLLLAGLLVLGADASVASVPVKKVARTTRSLPEIEFAGRQKAKMFTAEGSLKADFSFKGLNTEKAVWSEYFDGGAIPAGWTVDPTSYVTWTVNTYASKPFSDINPDDKGSLFVDGPYQTFRRETSSAVSAPIAVGSNATLRGYIGYSLNYEDTSSLKIEVSTDGFEEDITQIWNSLNGEGEKPWAWRPIAASLEDYAGQTVQLRFTYGPGTSDNFQTGGYLGSYYIDGLEITAVESVDGLDVETGETISLVDLSAGGEVTAWEWSFPGAVPATSTERNPEIYYTADGDYDITLTVTDSEGNTASVTRPDVIHVTGFAPTAKIGLPATFRNASTGKHFIAPLVPVTFTDESTGFPTSSEWTFTGVNPEPYATESRTGSVVEVGYSFLHDQSVFLEVENAHGKSTDMADLTVEYSGIATNFRSDDRATVFNLDGYGTFPGSNKMKITAYAEKFSKPSRPVRIYGAAVYFVENKAEEVIDQIANISVRLCKSENGLPGEELDFMCWSVFELDMPGAGGLVATEFPFTEAPVVDDEFFIVVDGIPEYSETCNVSFAMASFRGEGNTSYMLKDGKWVDVSTYFPAGQNHTSFLIQLDMAHSVMAGLPEGWTTDQTISATTVPELVFPATGGSKAYKIFSYMGWQKPEANGDNWFRVVSEPGDMTVDDITVEADPLPAGMDSREGELLLSDGLSTLRIPVRQEGQPGISTVTDESVLTISRLGDIYRISGGETAAEIRVSDLGGRTIYLGNLDADGAAEINASSWESGLYLITAGNAKARKLVK